MVCARSCPAALNGTVQAVKASAQYDETRILVASAGLVVSDDVDATRNVVSEWRHRVSGLRCTEGIYAGPFSDLFVEPHVLGKDWMSRRACALKGLNVSSVLGPMRCRLTRLYPNSCHCFRAGQQRMCMAVATATKPCIVGSKSFRTHVSIGHDSKSDHVCCSLTLVLGSALCAQP